MTICIDGIQLHYHLYLNATMTWMQCHVTVICIESIDYDLRRRGSSATSPHVWPPHTSPSMSTQRRRGSHATSPPHHLDNELMTQRPPTLPCHHYYQHLQQRQHRPIGRNRRNGHQRRPPTPHTIGSLWQRRHLPVCGIRRSHFWLPASGRSGDQPRPCCLWPSLLHFYR
jgi:hypothetical protein